jgi:hypothetical protein
MTNERRNFPIVAGVVLIVAALVGLFKILDYLDHRPRRVRCGSEDRWTVDSRQFEMTYSAYSYELKVSLDQKHQIESKITPVQVRQLSDAMQSASQHRSAVVASYNACIISSDDFRNMESQFQALDGLGRQIEAFLGRSTLSSSEVSVLSGLVEDYITTANRFSSEVKKSK